MNDKLRKLVGTRAPLIDHFYYFNQQIVLVLCYKVKVSEQLLSLVPALLEQVTEHGFFRVNRTKTVEEKLNQHF